MNDQSNSGCCCGTGGENTDNSENTESLGQIVADSFKGPLRWMSWVAWIEGIVVFGLLIWVGIVACNAEGLRETLLYTAAFLTLAMIMLLVKVWYWMLINRNMIRRDIKRLEDKLDDFIAKHD